MPGALGERAPARAHVRVGLRGHEAVAAAALTLAFIAITCWWLAMDRSLQPYDAGSHLLTAFNYRDHLAAGDIGGIMQDGSYYPPVIFLVGAIAALFGGVNVAAPVIGQNVVFVPLLALGCYGCGRIAYGPRAGLLAVVFALGAPLVIEQFHVFMIDGPVAAMVAVSAWLILASERFERAAMSALAGLACGVGIASKEQFLLYLAGLVVVVLVRGGFRNLRGLGVFCAVALAIAAPWYAIHFEDLRTYAAAALPNAATIPERSMPSLLSFENFTWYGWAILSTLLLAPLCLFAAIGLGRELLRLAPWSRETSRAATDADVVPELLAGLVVGWIALTVTPHHDIRYSLGLIVYLAVFGTGWIATAPRRARAIATTALAAAAAASVLGSAFGVGGQVAITGGDPPTRRETMLGVARAGQVVLYTDRNYIRAEPRRDAEALERLLAALSARADKIIWPPDQETPAFDGQGLFVAARLVGLGVAESQPEVTPRVAVLMHDQLVPSPRPPCVRMGDGSGVWVWFGMPVLGKPDYCPFRR